MTPGSAQQESGDPFEPLRLRNGKLKIQETRNTREELDENFGR
jgi:hypothetical protein